MNYYEILYENCFGQKFVALKIANSPQDFIDFRFNGIRVIGYCETTRENYASNVIAHFPAYKFSVE